MYFQRTVHEPEQAGALVRTDCPPIRDDGAAARPHRLLLRPRRQCPHSRRTAARSLENRPALRRHDRLPGLQVHGLDGHGDAVPANRMHDQKVHGLRRTHAYGRREKHRRHRIAYRLHDPALRRHPADVRRSQKRIERAGRDGMERNGAPDPHPGRIHSRVGARIPRQGSGETARRHPLRTPRGVRRRRLLLQRPAPLARGRKRQQRPDPQVQQRCHSGTQFRALARLLVAGSAGRNRLEPQPLPNNPNY